MTTIPTRIIQTDRTSNLRSIAKASSVNIKLLHPTWEHCFFDDKAVGDFVKEHFPEYVPVFESFPYPIQKIDFFRYLAVYRLGGYYFDLDVLLFENIEELCLNQAVFPFEEITMNSFLQSEYSMNWEIGNYGFGAAPGSEFIGRVIENCVRAQKDRDWVTPMMAGIPKALYPDFYVLNTTGPGLLTRTYAESPEAVRQGIKVLMPEDIYQANNWHQFGQYGLHLMEGSWHPKSGSWKRKIAWWRLARSIKLRNSMNNGFRAPIPTPILTGSK